VVVAIMPVAVLPVVAQGGGGAPILAASVVFPRGWEALWGCTKEKEAALAPMPPPLALLAQVAMGALSEGREGASSLSHTLR
jgi:hypothetical protein